MTDAAEALKRSARRRLIGAVALALVTVVALPMIFDKEPPPLAEVDIVIPSRDAPGSMVLLEGGANPLAGSATSQAATPTPPASIPSPTLGSPAVSAPVVAAPAPSASAPAPAVAQKPAASTTPVTVAPAATAAKIDLPKGSSVASTGYFLQLGVFLSEEGARKLAKRVAEAGFTVHVVEDAGRYKVRCGPVSAKPAAQDLQTRLRGKGFPAVLVSP